MEKEIKRFDIGSVAKVFFFIGLILGLIFGILFAVSFVIAGLFAFEAQSYATLPFHFNTIFALIGVVAFPIFYGVIFTIYGIIFAGFYNIISKSVGGIKAEFIE